MHEYTLLLTVIITIFSLFIISSLSFLSEFKHIALAKSNHDLQQSHFWQSGISALARFSASAAAGLAIWYTIIRPYDSSV